MQHQIKIPQGWVYTTIGDICSQPQYGYTTKASETGDLHLLRTTDISSGKINWDTVPYCSQNPEDKTKYLLEDGNIIVSRAGSVGVSCLIKKPIEAVFASYLIRFKPLVEPQFFKYFLDSPFYWNAISENQLGIAIPNVNANKLKSIFIPIAPENEQSRIVAKIEKLYSELDKGVESLETAREQLKFYRQAVLKHAFEGKLTEQWREKNKYKLETPEQFLTKIETESGRHYQEMIDKWDDAVRSWKSGGRVGKKPNKPKPRKPFEQISVSKTKQLPTLPIGWQWVSLSYLVPFNKKPMTTGPFGTMLKKHEHQQSGIPVFGIENIAEGRFVPGNKIFVSEKKAEALSSFEVQPGDLIISRSGTVGEICIVPEGLGKALISSNLIRISLNQKVILNSFFVLMFQKGGIIRGQVKELCKGSSREFLNQSILKSLVFPICSIREQRKILNEVDEKLSLTDKLLQVIDFELIKSSIIRQSILKQAFSGQLVEQDPNDEPASILLERIKEEKTEQEKTHRKYNRKKIGEVIV